MSEKPALAYTGVQAKNPPDMIYSNVNPSSANVNFPLGTFWINKKTATVFQLIGNPIAWAAIASPLGNTVTSLTVSGNESIGGNLSVTGLLSLGTSTLTTATLTSGTVTISLPAITATSRIILQRINTNSSTAIGNLTYAITAGTGFVVTSVRTASPGTTETNDVSNIFYLVLGGS
jgi:hypothetical protein